MKTTIKTKILKDGSGNEFRVKMRQKEVAKCNKCKASITQADLLFGKCSTCKKDL